MLGERSVLLLMEEEEEVHKLRQITTLSESSIVDVHLHLNSKF